MKIKDRYIKLKAWVKELQFIVQDYRAAIRALHRNVYFLEQTIVNRTTIDVSVSPSIKYPSTVIVCGNYRNNDYIQAFEVYGEDLNRLIDMLRDMRKYGRIRYIDAPLNIKEAFRRELDH